LSDACIFLTPVSRANRSIKKDLSQRIRIIIVRIQWAISSLQEAEEAHTREAGCH
jgi:hypothetical protein